MVEEVAAAASGKIQTAQLVLLLLFCFHNVLINMAKKSSISNRKCCVPGCNFFGESGYCKFPTDVFQKSAWLSALQMVADRPGDRVCFKHFKEEDFTVFSPFHQIKRLKKHVVPSFFLPPWRRTFFDGFNFNGLEFGHNSSIHFAPNVLLTILIHHTASKINAIFTTKQKNQLSDLNFCACSSALFELKWNLRPIFLLYCNGWPILPNSLAAAPSSTMILARTNAWRHSLAVTMGVNLLI